MTAELIAALRAEIEQLKAENKSLRGQIGALHWSADNTEQFKKMWAEGASIGLIAETLNMTRGAVSGKRSRLKLPGRPDNQRHLHRRGKGGKVAPIPGQQTVAPPRSQAVRPPKSKAVEPELPDPGTACTLLDLQMQMCRWPLDDRQFLGARFCGGKTEEGKWYCGYHDRIAHERKEK